MHLLAERFVLCFALLAAQFTDFVGLLVDCFWTIQGRLLKKGWRKPIHSLQYSRARSTKTKTDV
jgi:hypothetical protein